MAAPETHLHDFAAADWPFADPINTTAISTKRVFVDSFPILLVTHDDDGDWQILCGTTNAPEDGLVVCLGCAYQRDRTIGALADLPRGWSAWRDAKDAPWIRGLSEADVDGS
jgi:hypothetical protein